MRQPLAQWFKNQSPRFRFEKPVFPTAGRTLSALGHRRLNHNFVASGGFVRGRSSIGRARALQARGCRFEPDRLHCFCWCKTVLGCANPLYFNGLRRFLIHYPRFANCAPLCLSVPGRAVFMGGYWEATRFWTVGARGRCRWPRARPDCLLARPAGTVGLRWPKRDRSARGARRRWPSVPASNCGRASGRSPAGPRPDRAWR